MLARGGPALEQRAFTLAVQLLSLLAVLLCVSTTGPVMSSSTASPRPLRKNELMWFLKSVFAKNSTTHLCPAPPLSIKQRECNITPCVNDDDCDKNYACCFNGCIFTCLEQLLPPAVIDWPEEPAMTQFLNETTVHQCSTSPISAPARPRGCPEGQSCRITDPGDPLTGTPNSGICVPDITKESESEAEENTAYLESKGAETVFLSGGCALTLEQYGQLQSFLTHKHITGCSCNDGSVECQVAHHEMLSYIFKKQSQGSQHYDSDLHPH